MTDHDCPHAVTLRNLLDACDRGRPLTDITDRLRVEVGRLAGEGTTQPDAAEPTATQLYDAVKAKRYDRNAENPILTIPEIHAVLAARAEWLADRASGEGTAPPPDEDHGVRLVHFGCDECKQVGRVVTKLGPECLHCDLPRGHAGDCVPMVWPQPGTTPRIKPVHIDTPDDERGTAPQVPAEVLWEGETGYFAVDDFTDSHVDHLTLGVPPGTRVRVVAADGAPQEADRG